MSQAEAGMVFSVAIEPGKWGFVRFYRGLSMAILSVYGSSPEMPKVDWNNPPVGWTFFSFAPDADETEAISVGVVPFENREDEWGPPCFSPPDVIDNCYRIFEKGRMRKTKDKPAQGMKQCRTVTPEKLASFLRERVQAGELTAF